MTQVSRTCHGFLLMEVAVAISIVIVLATLVTTMCVRVGNLWQDIHHQRVAMNELSNHLDRLTRMETDGLKSAIDTIQPSPFCQQTLHEAQLAGEIVDSGFGKRVVLRLSWKRMYPAPPLVLTGWVDPDDSRRESR